MANSLALADEHDVIGASEHFQSNGRGCLDILETCDRPGFVGWAVHDGGIELDDAPLVGQPAEADGHVIGVFLDDSDARDDGFGGVPALVHEIPGFGDCSDAVAGSDANGPAVVIARPLSVRCCGC